MRTRFEIVLHGDDPGHLRAAGDAAIAEITACETRLSPFLPGSLVSRINACAVQAPVPVDGETFALLDLCRDIWLGSDGAFDITLGGLMRARGFRGGAGLHADAAWGFRHVSLNHRDRTVSFDRPGIALDLGAVGKGHALDLAAAELRAAGVTSAFLHAGTSSVLSLGGPPDGPWWRVAVSPEVGSPVVRLRDRALGVSAPRGRVVKTQDGPRGHVMDPRKGESVAMGGCAAVVTRSAALADAWSTALLVLGDGLPASPAVLAGIIDRGTAADPRWRVLGDESDCVESRAVGGAFERSRHGDGSPLVPALGLG